MVKAMSAANEDKRMRIFMGPKPFLPLAGGAEKYCEKQHPSMKAYKTFFEFATGDPHIDDLVTLPV